MKFAWTFDKAGQLLRSPSGYTVSVKEIAVQLHDRVNGHVDLVGAWSGWRIRGNVLTSPSGMKFTPAQLKSI